ncbi:MAG: glycosyltransferase family 4 protein [Chloroflexi bacterium]|nr:glycosyltransferase family 4 protein [Chloroflexota bacterium]
MARLRVALVSLYPFDPARVPGGVRAVAVNLAAALRADPDLELHVVCCHSDIPRDEVRREDGLTVHYLSRPRRRVIPNMITGLVPVARRLREIRPDVVNAHGSHYAVAALLAGFTPVWTLHGIAHREREVARSRSLRLSLWLTGLYDRYVLARVRDIIAVSPYVQREYQRLGGRRARWHVIFNPVPERFFAVRGDGRPGRVLMTGTIMPLKDVLTLVAAIERLRDEGQSVVLHVAGRSTDEVYFARVKEYVTAHKLGEHVRFLGLLDHRRLLAELKEARVVALASRQEAAPMSLAEAMAAGRPVVATRVGGVPDLVADGVTGFLVPPGDPAALAERLARILGDEASRRAMGERARKAAERFRASRVAAAYKRVYELAAAYGKAV